MAYVSSRTTGCVRITTAEDCTCLLVSVYASGKVDISAHNNVAPNSTYTKSVLNEFVMFPGSQLNIRKRCPDCHLQKETIMVQTDNKLHGHTLSRETSAKYVEVTITNDLKWDIHINNMYTDWQKKHNRLSLQSVLHVTET